MPHTRVRWLLSAGKGMDKQDLNQVKIYFAKDLLR